MDYNFLEKTNLFQGLNENEIKNVLTCLRAHEEDFSKGQVIYSTGQTVKEIGMVEEGRVSVSEYDYWGNKTIVGSINKGRVFALSLAANPGSKLQGDVIALEDSKLLFLDIKKLLTRCERSCSYHTKIIYNLFRISSEKTLAFHNRMAYLSQRTIRDKVIAYLSSQALKAGSSSFTIPFNRQDMADYLAVDRSALSKELSKMKEEGLISYKKNHFTLKDLSY